LYPSANIPPPFRVIAFSATGANKAKDFGPIAEL